MKKTGKPRIIYLSPEMLELTRRQMEKHPTGRLFLTKRGKPISLGYWASRFRQLRKKFPHLKGVVCYTMRHTFATDALIKGVGIRCEQRRGSASRPVLWQALSIRDQRLSRFMEPSVRQTTDITAR